MVAKIYLLVVAAIYFGLAIWCTVSPAMTSQKVGFAITDGSGQSEFMTVYGGLEFGIACVFALGVLRGETVRIAVLACVIIHGALVLFRSISFFMFRDIGSLTYKLAAGEWLIAIVGAAILIRARAKS